MATLLSLSTDRPMILNLITHDLAKRFLGNLLASDVDRQPCRAAPALLWEVSLDMTDMDEVNSNTIPKGASILGIGIRSYYTLQRRPFDAGFFECLSLGGFTRRFARLDMSFRNAPSAVAKAADQKNLDPFLAVYLA